jgi:hypothetical protein
VCDRDGEWSTTSAMAKFDGVDSFIHSWVCWHIFSAYCVAPSSSRSVGKGYVVTIPEYLHIVDFTSPKNVPGCDNGGGCNAEKHRFQAVGTGTRVAIESNAEKYTRTLRNILEG